MPSLFTSPRSVAVALAGSLVLSACGSLPSGDARSSSSSNAGVREASSPTAGQGRARRAGASATASMAFPTGDPGTSAIVLDKVAPAEVAVDAPYQVALEVENVSDLTLESVVVTETLPDGFQLTGSEPKASVRGGVATWALGALRPGASRTITLEGKATKPGDLVGCSDVQYASNLCTTTTVVSPSLQVAKTAPGEQLSCDPIELAYEVKNPGTGLARGVTVTETLPEGWTTMDGKNTVRVEIGDLDGGQSRTKKVRVKAASTGRFTSKAIAASTNGLRAESTMTTTTLRRPVLAVTTSAPETAFTGKPVKVSVTVKNTGDAPAEEVALVENVPSGVRVLSAGQGGKRAARRVTWDLGTIAAGAERTVDYTVSSDANGDIRCSTQVEAHCAEPTAASTTFRTSGIAAVLLQVKDLEDPIEVGKEVTYLIEVENQGSAPDTDIRVVCNLEDGVHFVRATGDSKANASGQTVRFDAIPVLAPKEVATMRLTVRASKPADSRFQVTLTTGTKTRPIAETEATTFYQ